MKEEGKKDKQVVFIQTTGCKDYLNDEQKNRRFIPLPKELINVRLVCYDKAKK